MSLMTLESTVGIQLAESRLIAVLVIDEESDAVPLARALLRGGVNIMELTLRTPAAIGALRRIREEVPEMTAGIGTILTGTQVNEVVDAGAHFGVAPAVNLDVMRQAKEKGLPFAPGIMTPTDIDQSMIEADCQILKYFPAESSGGLPHLNNIAAPFAHLSPKFIPLGGVNLENVNTYLENPHVIAVGGSWLAPRQVIAAQDWQTIEKNAAVARERIG